MSVSCKPKPEEPNYCATSPGGCNSVLIAKEFFLFKPGSWWVYEEEYSGVRDSMYVYSYANGDDYNFDIRIKSALTDYQYHYWPEYNANPNDDQCDQSGPVAKKCMNIKIAKFRVGTPGDFVGEGRCMFFQYNLIDSIPCYSTSFESNYIHITSIMESFESGGLNFGKTVKVNNKRDFQHHLHETNQYFSKGVGLTKIELIDTTETWNLVDYYIVP